MGILLIMRKRLEEAFPYLEDALRFPGDHLTSVHRAMGMLAARRTRNSCFQKMRVLALFEVEKRRREQEASGAIEAARAEAIREADPMPPTPKGNAVLSRIAALAEDTPSEGTGTHRTAGTSGVEEALESLEEELVRELGERCNAI